MLTLVDANNEFMYVDVGACGADSYVGVFRESDLYHALEQDKYSLSSNETLSGSDTYIPYFVVGDNAFAFRKWMMKPPSTREMTATDGNRPITKTDPQDLFLESVKVFFARNILIKSLPVPSSDLGVFTRA